MVLKDFSNLNFSSFQELAQDSTLSKYEKIGFPDTYREGFEEFIWKDILSKLPLLQGEQKIVLDIGPGCSDIPLMEIDHCERHKHQLLLADSPYMLDFLPQKPFTHKISGMFPDNAHAIKQAAPEGVDVIICYSVFHYLFVDTNIWDAIDQAILLLKPGGQMLIGDIPNVSMRKRFFASPAGIEFHKQYTQQSSPPEVHFNQPEPQKIDDAVVMSVLSRARAAGVDAYVVPQAPNLPMANRREDIVIYKP